MYLLNNIRKKTDYLKKPTFRLEMLDEALQDHGADHRQPVVEDVRLETFQERSMGDKIRFKPVINSKNIFCNC